ncbi:hypothetical protein [Photorhabdus khanii]|uniref:Uncharacterized protein n=3 Tax=Photorhabdus khanii TaxID=1004150 RepID=A0A4R4IRA9_9GAMM|nr:hypothetical protein [Photorhabdus khanii]ETS33640.1 hypothetical protein PTE_00816 [Photorhabdus khanii NC19]MQL46513.1 hypothetical protein [Photorhabdus khanii]OHV52224.1 hypothetical protein BB987_14840 [Photorhabdus temperata]TDB43257.1 hypothetical protein C5467_23420 [Photorhabdus khanii subsp. guanajuatensis]
MNKMPDNSIIVVDMAGNTLRLRVSGDKLVNKMKLLCFSLSDEFMELSIDNEDDKLKIIKTLINEDALFLYGNGWYPSEVMEYYKEKGIKLEKYKIIYWTDQKNYYIEER